MLMNISVEHLLNDADRAKPKYWEANLSIAKLSTSNLTWNDTTWNPGLCGVRQATNRLSNGTIKKFSTVTGLEPAIFGSEVRRLIH